MAKRTSVKVIYSLGSSPRARRVLADMQKKIINAHQAMETERWCGVAVIEEFRHDCALHPEKYYRR
mgnify:CR=1 FL=1